MKDKNIKSFYNLKIYIITGILIGIAFNNYIQIHPKSRQFDNNLLKYIQLVLFNV